MKNNETGEFELVLGNRQLLSGFFIVALLFGVAFAMGYIVGRNSTPSAKMQAETSAVSAAAPESRPQATPATPAPSSEQAPAPAGDTAATDQKPDDAPAQPTTQPAREGPAAPAPAANAAPAPASASEADSGTFWQVSAVSQNSAEIIAKALKDKGFPVTLSPGPRNLTRVLVGPYPDTQSLGRAKSELENAGFYPILLKK
jgi:cell division septation protein DedD